MLISLPVEFFSIVGNLLKFSFYVQVDVCIQGIELEKVSLPEFFMKSDFLGFKDTQNI